MLQSSFLSDINQSLFLQIRSTMKQNVNKILNYIIDKKSNV